LQRVVEPEILDQLAPDDPRALRARRDLRRVNALMFQDLIVARALAKYCTTRPRVFVDLGSGDGTFILKVARRLAKRWQNVELVIVDQADAVAEETRAAFTALSWKVNVEVANVFDFMERTRRPDIDVMTANMFLHHFPEPELARLLAKIARVTPLFIVGELRRTKFVREAGRNMWLLGGGDVICYDGRVSARAAFIGQELSALWPKESGWQLTERAVGPWTHLFVAQRQSKGIA
jgi:SAM-dependent methyltransferase